MTDPRNEQAVWQVFDDGDGTWRDLDGEQNARYWEKVGCKIRALYPRPADAYPEAAEVCAQAYQVVGSLLSDLGQFGTGVGRKILDNLSQRRLVHDDVLPWPSFTRPADARVPEGCVLVSKDQILSRVAGPFMYHYEMSDCEMREGKGFDRCRELTIQNIESLFNTLATPPAAKPEPCPCGEATCEEPWEPGCGLGRSEEHVRVAANPEQGEPDEDDYESDDRFVGHLYADAPEVAQPKPAGEAVDTEDAARLDWFDSMLSEHGCIWFMPSGPDFRFIQVRGADGYCENFPAVNGSIRDAIDAARRLSGQEG